MIVPPASLHTCAPCALHWAPKYHIWSERSCTGRSPTAKNRSPHLKLKIYCWCFPCSCLTSGTHMAAPKQTYPAQFCHLALPSQTSHNTAHLCLTPLKASILTNLIPMTFMRSQGLSTRADVSTDSLGCCKLHVIWFPIKESTFNVCICVSGPEYEEVEVHLLREKTGFGFRILGGDEAVQAVSPDARDKARMGRAGPHAYLTSYTLTLSDLHLTSSYTSVSYKHLTNIPSPSTHTHTLLHKLLSTSHTEVTPC